MAVSGDSLYACDWHGNVYRFGLKDGRLRWRTNVTDRIWRDDIEELPATPYVGATYGAPSRRPAEQPLAGRNLAPDAKVSLHGISNWFCPGKVLADPAAMANGKLNDLGGPWMELMHQFKAPNWSNFVWAEFEWPEPVTISGISIHEDERHPESFPWSVSVQAWKDGAWHDVAVSFRCPGPWHNIALDEPIQADRVRYCVLADLTNNVWTDEIRVIAE